MKNQPDKKVIHTSVTCVDNTFKSTEKYACNISVDPDKGVFKVTELSGAADSPVWTIPLADVLTAIQETL